VARGALAPEREEAAAIRLRLEVGIAHDDALAVVRGGYLTAAEVAAAEDEEFSRRVHLPAERRRAVLAAARAPGSHAARAGARPRLLREQPVAPAVIRAAEPVRRVVTRALGEAPPAPDPPTGPKPAPPHASPDHDRRKRLRRDAEAAERDLDEALGEGERD
jgi:hypothetical protein